MRNSFSSLDRKENIYIYIYIYIYIIYVRQVKNFKRSMNKRKKKKRNILYKLENLRSLLDWKDDFFSFFLFFFFLNQRIWKLQNLLFLSPFDRIWIRIAENDPILLQNCVRLEHAAECSFNERTNDARTWRKLT